MSLHVLEVSPRDVAADALGLLLDAPAPPALAELVLRSGPDRLVLGVLGSSHVVSAHRGGERCVEQVSCEAVAAGGLALPPSHETGPYELRSSTEVLPRADVDALAGRLRTAAELGRSWLCGAFPAPAAAVTALTGRTVPGGWAWQTWHLYPGETHGIVVRTSSRWTP